MKKWMFYLLICTLCMSAGSSVGFRSTDETKKSNAVEYNISDIKKDMTAVTADRVNLECVASPSKNGTSEFDMVFFRYDFIRAVDHFTLYKERLKLNSKTLADERYNLRCRNNC